MAMTEPNRLLLWFSSISLFMLFQPVLAQNGTLRLSSGAELSALLDLRSSLGLRSRDWPRKAEPCSWVGVRCGGGGRVVEINVSGLRRTRDGRANPRFAVDALSNFTHLVSFNASGFSLPGSIPEWFGQRLTALQVLDLRSASVDGSIPASLGALGGLEALYLSGNNLTGNVPSALGRLLQLSVLDLSMNFLTGAVPPDFAFLGNLTRLDLSGNFLSGSVPPGLGRLSSLESLNLSDNSLSGSVPGELGNASRLVELDLGKNSLSGSLPVELGGLRSLRKMVIGYNGLDGPLPDGFFLSLAHLEVVVLSGNKLDGSLPGVLWSMPNLSFVDVSSNNFTGVLPSLGSYGNDPGGRFNLSNNLFYGALTSPLGKFRFIDLSGNYLQGKVLDDDRINATLNQNCLQDVLNQKNLEDCRLFYAERGLSFDEFGVQEPAQSPSSPALNNSKRLTFILVGVFGGLGFIFLLVLVLVLILRVCDKGNANQRSNANVGPVPEGGSSTLAKDPIFISDLGESFSYEQMLLSTGDFSEENLIKHGHSGDLYRGILEGGTPVVIKKVDLRFVKKDSHMVELEFFSKVSHTRLALLLGHCLEHENDKLLVYKYMPNGDLATSFYRVANPEADGLQSLDWITRLKIATGAAEGLSYLHHECAPSIVHRDVQASSILLDDKFEVRLGSLSEVHTQGDTHQNVLTRLLWKPPTSDQGPSGSSTVTCAYDVYCFGKVLLELVTGKLGISRSDDSSTTEWLEQTLLPYISIYDKELITKIVDPSLVVDEDLLEEVWAMAVVAKSCLNPKPSRRPPMKYILKALENPWKVVREDSSHSARRSWSAAVFGSWRQNSSESSNVLGHASRDGLSGLRQPGRVRSQGSGGIEHSSSHKRLSNDIFPEPVDMQEIEMEAR